jgi:hypothetical protein
MPSGAPACRVWAAGWSGRAPGSMRVGITVEASEERGTACHAWR